MLHTVIETDWNWYQEITSQKQKWFMPNSITLSEKKTSSV